MTSCDSARIAIIDVETTGLFPARDRVLEVAAVVMSPNGHIHAEYETLVNPNRDVGATKIHGITAGEIARAPAFEQIAGDLLAILMGCHVVAGHNISFDRAFIFMEFERIDIILPDFDVLCTCQQFGRGSLRACCDELGITIEGAEHHAISDARATARLVMHLCEQDSSLLERFMRGPHLWPVLPAQKTPCISRELAKKDSSRPPAFLQRLAQKACYDTETEPVSIIAYMTLLDRVLEDRLIDEGEDKILGEMASQWGLSREDVDVAHTNYLQSLAVFALADGMVSDSERRDLHHVARLLGRDEASLDKALESASKQLAALQICSTNASIDGELAGKTVCFTGEMLSRINGEAITRSMAQELSRNAGLVVLNGVSKKLDILVVADPNTQSGKAKKAREYNCRVLADNVFWRMLGVDTD